jgi:hypothetical protein
MATLVLQYAGAALGGLFGGPLGAIIGRAAGAIAGGFIDAELFGEPARRVRGPRLQDLRVMGSTEGSAIPRAWGRMRVAGEVIWATNFEEVVSTQTEGGSKGAGSGPKTKVTQYDYFANFAVALAEGAISRIGRVWADGKEFDLSGIIWRFYPGSDDQEPDSLIVAKEGGDAAPAYRGTSYIVFERLALERFGNRLPQLSFEIFRPLAGFADRVRAVNIIPGSTEFGYDTAIITRDAGGGETLPENTHMSAERSDWTVSLDSLAAAAPNLEAASLVVAWFGTDLRCGSCSLHPGVETRNKATRPDAWKVAGLTRTTAHLVSEHEAHPAFGGTPADRSVLRAIADLKARGLRVVFYPFILMDIPADNPEGQPAYPWRGRITCDPPPGEPGTPDKTPAVNDEINAFIGSATPGDFGISDGAVIYSGPAEWSLRRMVLHYAKLCALAGGVDAFLIASELRGLTTLRSDSSTYPFVEALAALAADVRAILPDAKISYAADWSEYSGHQPDDGSGDRFFHLDPLWSSSAVDFIGIDNYMPLTDWRDGSQHLDRLAGVNTIYDRNYLRSGIAGGEGYDWFYASAEDREQQTRTPITDGAYGKPWVYRFKDLKSWWSEPHFDRPGGIEDAIPTGWLPESKPIWFTETGIPAIDKGSNQPNIFFDAKSSESGRPYFSSGARDDFIQARAIEVVSDHWSEAGGHNPVSSAYGRPMIEPGNIFWWAWDARPHPAFPALKEVWADAENYAHGHWLNGRIDAVPLENLITAICEHYRFGAAETQGLEGLIDGVMADQPMSARALIEPIARAFSFDAVESDGKIRFRMRNLMEAAAIDANDLVENAADQPLFKLTRAQETGLPTALRLAYAESGLDYRRAAVEARRLIGDSLRETAVELPCAIEQDRAQIRADILLQEAWAGRENIEFSLPPSLITFEPGDQITAMLGSGGHRLRLESVTDGVGRRVVARSHDAEVYAAIDAPARGGGLSVPSVIGPPLAEIADLPVAGEGIAAHAPWVAAVALPWPGELAVLKREGESAFSLNRRLAAPAVMGEIIDALPAGPVGLYDRGAKLRVKLYSGSLASVGAEEFLTGANAAAIGSNEEGWEIIQYRDAVLIAPKTYEISWLLRGQSGSEPEMLPSRPAGTRFILLDPSVVQLDLALAELRLEEVWRIGPSNRDHGDPSYVELRHSANGIGLRPLAPVHLRARRDGGDIVFSWIRRTRIDGDGWELSEVPIGEEREAYEAEIIDGGTPVRTVSVLEPLFRYTAAAQSEDFDLTVPPSITLRIYQMSNTYGRGAALEATVHI